MVPKHIFSGKQIVQITTQLSACIFNEGTQTILKTMEIMGIKLGRIAVSFAEARNYKRIKKADKTTFNTSKEARIRRKSTRSEENHLG